MGIDRRRGFRLRVVAFCCGAAFVVGLLASPAAAYFSWDSGCVTWRVVGSYQSDYRDTASRDSGGWDGSTKTTAAPSAWSNNLCYAASGYVVESSIWMAPRATDGTALPLCALDYDTGSNGSTYSSAHCSDSTNYAKMRYLWGHRAWFAGTPYDLYRSAEHSP